MKFDPRPLAMLAAVMFASGATAQLRAPRDLAAPAAGTPAGASVPAATTGDAEKEAAGSLAAAGWLVLLDRKDWGRAWESSSAMFRSTVPLAAWMDGMPKIRGEFGAFTERTPVNAVYKTTLQGKPDGEYVTVIFDTKFEKKELEEIVTTVREADGKWRITGYSTR